MCQRLSGDVVEPLQDVRKIRSRRKVNSAVKSASAFVKTQEEFGGFDAYN